jgi:hypothetical protein
MSTVPPNENKDLVKEVEVAPEKAFSKTSEFIPKSGDDSGKSDP